MAIYYIKLGKGGEYFEQEAKPRSILILDYRNVPPALIEEGKWDEIKGWYIANGATKGTATSHSNQIAAFCESDEKDLWITFSGNQMYWTRINGKTLFDDVQGRKTRSCIGWKSVNLQNQNYNPVPGSIEMVRGFRGTICRIKDYRHQLIENIIEGKTSPELIALKEAKEELVQRIKPLILQLHWRDFEILIDLIFRQSGLFRSGELGGSLKTIDFQVSNPITADFSAVQVKSMASKADFESDLDQMDEFEKIKTFFYIVHQPKSDLKGMELRFKPGDKPFTVEFWFEDQIAEKVVRLGLVDWIMEKSI